MRWSAGGWLRYKYAVTPRLRIPETRNDMKYQSKWALPELNSVITFASY